MGLILDTCVLIAVEKKKISFEKISTYGKTFITTISVSEILMGIKLGENEIMNRERTIFAERIFNEFIALPFCLESGKIHADIHADLWRKGNIIGAFDLLIAAIALYHDYSIVTGNIKEFSRVKGLKIIDMNDLLK